MANWFRYFALTTLLTTLTFLGAPLGFIPRLLETIPYAQWAITRSITLLGYDPKAVYQYAKVEMLPTVQRVCEKVAEGAGEFVQPVRRVVLMGVDAAMEVVAKWSEDPVGMLRLVGENKTVANA
ncbi:hypothetical protein HDU97_005598 [Phlyctochytrium planicorne]|nr:hypothetical protein HDU97_005598 [Phlyctochytrium planicorne]